MIYKNISYSLNKNIIYIFARLPPICQETVRFTTGVGLYYVLRPYSGASLSNDQYVCPPFTPLTVPCAISSLRSHSHLTAQLTTIHFMLRHFFYIYSKIII